MGRPENPVNPTAGPVQRLAHELRELRRAAGSPPYRAMARATGLSATTLSQAAAGKRLPSLAVVHGYVDICGGDRSEWERRWTDAQVGAVAAVRSDDDDCQPPYLGPRGFDAENRNLFFGREQLVDQLLQLLSENRIVAVIGASGSGKSSLLRAGLAPRLSHPSIGSQPHPVRLFTPGAEPASTHGHLLASAGDGTETWLVVDQFEEIFTQCHDRQERDRFINQLLAARDPRSRLRVVIGLRSDSVPRCSEHGELATVIRRCALAVGSMTANQLRMAVVRPAQSVGLLVERELAARIVGEVTDQPGALPVLSCALLETWRRRRGRTLTVAAYEAAGGVRGAIADCAEEMYQHLSADQAYRVRRLLLRLIEPGQNAADGGRRLTHAEMRELAGPGWQSALERLARARLVTVDEEGALLAHDALISCWPRLSNWIEEERERLLDQKRLTEASRAWSDLGCEPEALYRGGRLAVAERLFAEQDREHSLTATERAFLTAALEAREVERIAAVRTTRRTGILAIVSSTALALALVLSLAVWKGTLDRQRQRADSAARHLASVADSLRTTDPRTAMQLGVAAWRTSPLPESRRALLGSLAQPELDAFMDPAVGDRRFRLLTRFGRELLSADSGSWQTWDVAGHRPTGSGRLPEGSVEAGSPDSTVLAIAGRDGLLRLWDRNTSRWIFNEVSSPAWSDVGFAAGKGRGFLLTAGDFGVQVRSVADGSVRFAASDTIGRANVALDPDGQLIATCRTNAAPQVWDAGRGRAVAGVWEQARSTCSDSSQMVFGPAGGRFAAVSARGIAVWEVRSGRQVAHIDDTDVRDAAFSPSGTFLATTSLDEIRIWRLGSPDIPVFRYPLDNQRLRSGLAWDPNGRLLRYLEGATIHTLDIEPAMTSGWRSAPLSGVQLSPDGRTLATAERTASEPHMRYRFELRETGDGRVLRTLPSQALPVARDPTLPVRPEDTRPVMAFSPDGSGFAYGVTSINRRATPQRLTIWDVRANRERVTLDLTTAGSAAALVAMALGPHSRTLHVTRTNGLGDLEYEAWDTNSGRRIAGVGPAASLLAISPDGGLVVGDHSVLELSSGTVAEHDLVQGDEVDAVAFSPNGSRLVAGEATGRVAVWNGALRQRTTLLPNSFADSSGNPQFPEGVGALALSPDTRTLAVGGAAGTLRLWDITTQQPLGGPFTMSGDAIESLAFSSDGRTLYAAGAHVALQRYTIDPEGAVARVCERFAMTTPTDHWQTYLPGKTHMRLCV
jgi:WD40 repeat protein